MQVLKDKKKATKLGISYEDYLKQKEEEADQQNTATNDEGTTKMEQLKHMKKTKLAEKKKAKMRKMKDKKKAKKLGISYEDYVKQKEQEEQSEEVGATEAEEQITKPLTKQELKLKKKQDKAKRLKLQKEEKAAKKAAKQAAKLKKIKGESPSLVLVMMDTAVHICS